MSQNLNMKLLKKEGVAIPMIFPKGVADKIKNLK